MIEHRRLLLNDDGILLLRRLFEFNHYTFQQELYDSYYKSEYPEKLKYFARRVHFDPLFVLSFPELQSYLAPYIVDFEDPENVRTLLVFYSVFILNVTGKMAVWNIIRMSSLNENELLRLALKNFKEFNTVTNLIYNLLSFPKRPTKEDHIKGNDWKELIDRKRRSIRGEPKDYFKEKYYMTDNDGFLSFITTLLKSKICIVGKVCNRCYGHHFTSDCDSKVETGKVILLDRWMSRNFDYDIDERLKDVLEFPLFSVYLAIAVCRGNNTETVCHSITDL